MANAIANRMANRMRPAMALPMANAWQNTCPVPVPTPRYELQTALHQELQTLLPSKRTGVRGQEGGQQT